MLFIWVKQWFVGDFQPFFPTICLLLTSHDHDFPTEALRRALQQVGFRWNWGHLSHVSRILILLGYKFLLIFSLRHSAVVSEHALGERKQEKTRLNMLIDEHHSQFSTAQRPKDLGSQILTAGGESRHDDGSHGFWQPREREGNGAENLKHLSGKLLCIYMEIRYEDRMGDSVKDRMIYPHIYPTISKYPHIYPRYEDSMGDSGTLKSDLFHTGQVFREPSLKNFSANRAVLRWKLSPNLTKTYWHILTLNWTLNETALPNELQNSISLLL